MEYFTVEQVAEKLQLSVRTIRGYIKSGKMPASSMGKRRYRISQDQLDRFMQATEVKLGQDNQED